MRHAAQSAEGDDVGDEDNDEEQRLARNQEQHARAEKSGHQQINENCQSKLHRGHCKRFQCEGKAALKFPQICDAGGRILPEPSKIAVCENPARAFE